MQKKKLKEKINKLSKKSINNIFEIFKKNNPSPTTELIYHSDFELLIAVILSAQATDISVNKATTKLFKVASTPQDIYKLGEAELKEYIKTIGLFNNKAKNIIATCKKLITQFNNKIPQNRKDLESLSGVGRKTANVILNTLYGEKLIAVDTHVHRVANRIGLANAKTVMETERQIMQSIPDKYLVNAHHWLILHGRYVCKAKNPNCISCSIKQWCLFYNS